MPELPEVEITRRSFMDRIAGARVLAVQTGQPLRWPLGCEPQSLVGRQVLQVGRRGKYLLLHLDQGLLLVHLGMSGSLRFDLALGERGRHDHFDLLTSRGVLRLHDPRRFGAVVYADSLEAPVACKLLGGLGMEPLDGEFDLQAFRQGLACRRTSIKQVLLGGELVVGVGNIYASEALFLAGIRPTVRADRIGPLRAQRLRQAIIDVLGRALALGGSTLRDFSSADGQSGYFQMDASVYGREGQPCRRCASAIRRIVQAQRSSYFCPACQKA